MDKAAFLAERSRIGIDNEDNLLDQRGEFDMALLAIVFGGLLIALGLLGYFAPGTFGEYEKVSMTSLIPAYIGAALLLCGLIALAKPMVRKHTMHLAVVAGVFGFVGGFMPLFRSNFNFNKASAVSGVLLSGISLMFVILCAKSFIEASKARQGG